MEKISQRKWKNLKIFCVLAIATLLSFGIYEHETKSVTISIDDEKTTVKTVKKTVKDLLEKEDIRLGDGSHINCDLDDRLKDGSTIIIKNPKTYYLKIGDKKMEIQSTNDVVGEILGDLAIELDKDDYTEPGIHEKILPETEIDIIRMNEDIEIVKESIPYEEVIKNNKQLEKGKTKVVQKGQEGKKEIKIKKIYKNGEVVDKKVVSEKVVANPVNKVIEKGTKKKDIVVASRGGGSREKIKAKNTLVCVATAYDLSYASCGKNPGDRGYGITASGTRARPGVVAVDPKVIPLGTKLYIKSLDGTRDYGYAVAEDTGSAIKGNRVDLFFSTKGEVNQFGRRQVKVYILDN